MPSNDFLPFAGGSSANVLSQPDYAALTAILQNGFSSGVAQSAQVNKVLRQSSVMAAVIGQFIVSKTGQDAKDDGATATLLSQLAAAISITASGLGAAAYRLSNSGGTLLLRPFGGNTMLIPGLGAVTIPSAGVSLAASGLTAGTTYNIYATVTGGNLVLEASTVGHATDATTGIEIKSGDSTRVFVGMERASAATTWQGLCRSWRNDPGFITTAPLTASASTTSGSFVEISTNLRLSFLCFADETVSSSFDGPVTINTLGAGASTSAMFDTSSTSEEVAGTTSQESSNGYNLGIAGSLVKRGLTEGYHYLKILGAVTAGTCSWVGGSNPGTRFSARLSIGSRN